MKLVGTTLEHMGFPTQNQLGELINDKISRKGPILNYKSCITVLTTFLNVLITNTKSLITHILGENERKYKKTPSKTQHPRIQRKKRARTAKIATSQLCIRTCLRLLCVLVICETPIPLVVATGDSQPPSGHLSEMKYAPNPALRASDMSDVANFGLYSSHSIMEFVSRHAVVAATVLAAARRSRL